MTITTFSHTGLWAWALCWESPWNTYKVIKDKYNTLQSTAHKTVREWGVSTSSSSGTSASSFELMISAYGTGWYPGPWPLLGSSDPSCISSSWPSLPPHSLGSLPLSPHLLIVCRTVRCLWGWGCTCPCAYIPSSHLPTLPRCRPQLLLSGPGWPGTGSCKDLSWRGVHELA